MSWLKISPKRVLIVIIAISMVGMVIVGMTIALNPPTADIPEPLYFSVFSESYRNIFRYNNNTQGGCATNIAEFHISYENIESGSAFLRLRTISYTIWVRDITSNQPNTSLIVLDEISTILRLIPDRDANEINVQSINQTAGPWWSIGLCHFDIRTRDLLGNMATNIEFGFRVRNEVAKDYDGHQFYILIEANVTYNAYYLGGIINNHYQDGFFNWTIGEDYPVYMLPYDDE